MNRYTGQKGIFVLMITPYKSSALRITTQYDNYNDTEIPIFSQSQSTLAG